MFWLLFFFPPVHCDSGAAGGDGGDADDNSGVRTACNNLELTRCAVSFLFTAVSRLHMNK